MKYLIVYADGKGQIMDKEKELADEEYPFYYKIILGHHKIAEIITEKNKVIKVAISSIPKKLAVFLIKDLNWSNPLEYEDQVVDINLS